MILLMRFIVSGHSMLPTFKPGQTVLVSSIPYWFRNPKIGEVVVIKNPKSEKLLLKRITKVVSSRHSGDSERSVEDSRIPLVTGRFWTSQNDDKEYFVSGDNIDDSMDSRVFGPITRKEILGTVIVSLKSFRYNAQYK